LEDLEGLNVGEEECEDDDALHDQANDSISKILVAFLGKKNDHDESRRCFFGCRCCAAIMEL
jgi:hypothetical protein